MQIILLLLFEVTFSNMIVHQSWQIQVKLKSMKHEKKNEYPPLK